MTLIKSYVDGKLVQTNNVSKKEGKLVSKTRSKLKQIKPREDITKITASLFDAGVVKVGDSIQYSRGGLEKFGVSVYGKVGSLNYKTAFNDLLNIANAAFIYEQTDNIKKLPIAVGRSIKNGMNKTGMKIAEKARGAVKYSGELINPETEAAAEEVIPFML